MRCQRPAPVRMSRRRRESSPIERMRRDQRDIAVMLPEIVDVARYLAEVYEEAFEFGLWQQTSSSIATRHGSGWRAGQQPDPVGQAVISFDQRHVRRAVANVAATVAAARAELAGAKTLLDAATNGHRSANGHRKIREGRAKLSARRWCEVETVVLGATSGEPRSLEVGTRLPGE